MTNNPFDKPMSEWNTSTDIDAAIDWNKKRKRKERLRRLAEWAFVFITAIVAGLAFGLVIGHL